MTYFDQFGFSLTCSEFLPLFRDRITPKTHLARPWPWLDTPLQVDLQYRMIKLAEHETILHKRNLVNVGHSIKHQAIINLSQAKLVLA